MTSAQTAAPAQLLVHLIDQYLSFHHLTRNVLHALSVECNPIQRARGCSSSLALSTPCNVRLVSLHPRTHPTSALVVQFYLLFRSLRGYCPSLSVRVSTCFFLRPLRCLSACPPVSSCVRSTHPSFLQARCTRSKS